MLAMSKSCWNCGKNLEILRSQLTGNKYCAACGAAADGVSRITGVNEPQRPARRNDRVKDRNKDDPPNN
jgi:hypothetical protein